jgi:hypothetical protein
VEDVAATTTPAGSAERWGRAWEARPADWAVSEEQQVPTYDKVAEWHVLIARA